MSVGVAQTWYMMGRQLRNLMREPIWIALMLVQPMFWLLLYSQLFRRIVEAYEDYTRRMRSGMRVDLEEIQVRSKADEEKRLLERIGRAQKRPDVPGVGHAPEGEAHVPRARRQVRATVDADHPRGVG